jgi:O-antigen/teichoic acid export membrane protein
MSREKNLFKNTIIFMIGNFASKFLVFLMLPFYTAFLSKEEYGYYDIIITTVMVFMPIISFQLLDGLYRELLDSKDNEEFSKLLSNTYYIVIRNSIVFVSIGIILHIFFRIQYAPIIIILILSTIAMNLWQQICRGLKRNKVYSISGIVYAVLMVALNIGAIRFLNFKVEGLIYANILSCLLTVVYLEFNLKVFKYLGFSKLNSEIRKKLLSYSIPLLPTAINWWVLSFASRYIIGAMLGQNYNGIFAVSSKFPAILLMVNNIFYLAWQESAISEYKSEDKDLFYTKMFNLYAKIQLSALVILLPFTKVIIALVIGSEFKESWEYIPMLYVGAVFLSFGMFYGTGYLSSKETKGAFTTTLASSIINVALIIVGIPILKLQAVAIASALSYLVLWVIRVFQTKKYFIIRIDYKMFGVFWLLFTISILCYYLGDIRLNCISVLVLVVLISIMNRELFSSVTSKIGTKLTRR